MIVYFLGAKLTESIMSNAELNSYRLTSLEEPTDEMLSAIMKEAAKDAAERSAEAHKRFFDEIDAQCDAIKTRL